MIEGKRGVEKWKERRRELEGDTRRRRGKEGMRDKQNGFKSTFQKVKKRRRGISFRGIT